MTNWFDVLKKIATDYNGVYFDVMAPEMLENITEHAYLSIPVADRVRWTSVWLSFMIARQNSFAYALDINTLQSYSNDG
jgi:hypothetical protein